jgi:K+-transporting ATPase KdpF subunit
VKFHGSRIPERSAAVFGSIMGIRQAVRTLDGRQSMTALYVIAGAIALALLIYLFVAMLKPEMFE